MMKRRIAPRIYKLEFDWSDEADKIFDTSWFINYKPKTFTVQVCKLNIVTFKCKEKCEIYGVTTHQRILKGAHYARAFRLCPQTFIASIAAQSEVFING